MKASSMPHVAPGETFRLNVSTILPPIETPYGKVVLPNLTAASVDAEAGLLKLDLANPEPGEYQGKLQVRALFPNGEHFDLKELPGDTSGEIAIPVGELKTKDGKAFAIGSVHWQIVRQISTDSYLAGALKKGEPIEFAGNTLSIRPRPDMAAMQSRTGIDFVREKSDGSMEILGKAHGLDGYQTGSKVQPIAYSGDLSRVYVGGNKGQVYVIDTLSFQLIDTLKGLGVNITSLAASGNLLLIGEGNNYGGSNFRLLALDINPGSRGYHDFYRGLRQVQGAGIEESPLGAGGMVVGPDGRTLVLSLPRQSNNSNVFGANAAKQRGDIRVIDLDSMDELGHVDAPVKAVLPSDGISGKSGQIIRATQDADR